MGPRSHRLWWQVCPPWPQLWLGPSPCPLPRPQAPTIQAPSSLGCRTVMPADPQHPFLGQLSSSACSAHAPFLFWFLPRPEGCLQEDPGSWAEQPSTNSSATRGSCGPHPRAARQPWPGVWATGRLPSQHWAQVHLSQWTSWGRGLETTLSPSFPEHLVAIRGRGVRGSRQGSSRRQQPRMT